jgi:hypothetical protein
MTPQLSTLASTRPLCAWASRHAPTIDLRAALAAADYRIVQVRDAREPVCSLIWMDIVIKCAAIPDVVVIVTRHQQYLPLLRHITRAAPATRMIFAPMQLVDGDWVWSGAWRHYCLLPDGTSTVTPWQPTPEAQP